MYVWTFSLLPILPIGHVLSMPHDDSKTCQKLFGDIDGQHLMAPFFVHLNETLPWSPCSAIYITEFFDNGHGMDWVTGLIPSCLYKSSRLTVDEQFCLHLFVIFLVVFACLIAAAANMVAEWHLIIGGKENRL